LAVGLALATAATLGAVPAAMAGAPAPTAPPEVLAAPSGTVTEETPVTVRIRAGAGDRNRGNWALLLESGNFVQVELKQGADSTVYERTFRLHNEHIYAAQPRNDEVPDFDMSAVTARIFGGTVKWRIAFFPDGRRSRDGDARTRTPEQTFEFAPTFQRRQHVDRPRLPSTRSRRIVPNKSIAGIALRARRSRVVGLWGTPFISDEMLFDRRDYYAKGSVEGDAPRTRGDEAGVEYDQDEAALIYLARPRQDPGGLGRLKTSRGIGLGSRGRALRRAYPRLIRNDREDEEPVSYTLQGRGGVETVFSMRRGRVSQILLRDPI
jgi:hypothetical protein